MKKFTVLFICLLFFGSLFSQRAYFDREKITIGDQCVLSIVINKDKGKIIEFPVFDQVIVAGLEIIKQTNVTESEDGKTLKQDFTVTSFTDSLFIVPPFKINVDGNPIETNAVKLEVMKFIPDSAFLSKIDTTQQVPLADIKNPMDTPITFKELFKRFWYLLVIIVVIALFIWLYQYLNKRKKITTNEEVNIPVVIIPAHEIAFRQLDELKASGKHKELNLNPFYIELSKIIRQYLESRFQIPALESATFEIIREFNKNTYSNPDINTKLQELLSLSDLVKFAQDKPDEYRNELMFEYAYSFIRHTFETHDTNLSEEIIEEK